MATCFESNKDTSGNIVRKHPVPNRWGASLVVCLGEDKLGGLEAICLGHCDGQPDDVEEEVQHDETTRDTKDELVVLWVQVVHADRDEQHSLCHNPLHGSELDVVDISREVDAEDGKLREQVVCCTLRVGGNKGGPCSGTPPCNNETEKATILATTGFSSPKVDRSSSRKSRADLCKNGSRDEDEEASDDVA